MFQVIKEHALASTNTYAIDLVKKGALCSPTLVIAETQLKGRGQATNQWFSEKGKSLTFSLVLFPQTIKPERQFVLSQLVCLAIHDTLSQYTDGVSIKWPNDVYLNAQKCCGVLIENAISGENLAYSVCGVGLNVNNETFSGNYIATSLYKETGQLFDLDDILAQILGQFTAYYQKAEAGEYAALNSLYHKYLYQIGVISEFADKKGAFRACVVGIDQYGQLLLKDTEDQLRTYGFKEVVWLP